MKDFEDMEGDDVDADFPLKRLTSIEIFNIDIGGARMWEILEPSMKSETLKSIRCHEVPVYVHEITLKIVRLWGSSLRELVLYTYEPFEGLAVKSVNLAYVFSCLRRESIDTGCADERLRGLDRYSTSKSLL